MRHLRFRMRTIFVLVTLSAVGYALSITEAQRQRAAVAEIKSLGGHVLYEAAAYDAEPLRLIPLLTSALGPDWFHSVNGVLIPRATDRSIVYLQALPETRKLYLCNSALSNRGIGYITALPRLESLHFDRGVLTDAYVGSLSKLKGLKHLEVKGTAITDASLPVISQMPAIRSVILTNCNVTHQGLAAFSKSQFAWSGASSIKFVKQADSVFLPTASVEELDSGWGSFSKDARQFAESRSGQDLITTGRRTMGRNVAVKVSP